MIPENKDLGYTTSSLLFVVVLLLLLHFMHMGILPACVLCTTCVPGAGGGQEKALDP